MSTIINDLPVTAVAGPVVTSPPTIDPPGVPTETRPEFDWEIQRFVVSNVGWPNYVLISDGVGERHIRVTYDGKEVELMSLSKGHESWARVIERLIGEICTELGTDYVPCGSMTLRRQDVTRGLEPDNSFYIANAAAAKGISKFDLSVHPGPDLVVEVEISRSVLDRIGIYETLGVRELWRATTDSLRVYVLGNDRHFHEAPTSLAFPTISMPEFQSFVKEADGNISVEIIRRFREWVRRQPAQPAGS